MSRRIKTKMTDKEASFAMWSWIIRSRRRNEDGKGKN